MGIHGYAEAAGNSQRELDHELGREKHVEEATALPSPYKPGATMDPGLRFAARTMAVWGPHIAPWRAQQEFMFLRLADSVRPLTEALRRLMPETVKHVAGKRNPALIALITILLKWPARRLAVEYVMGHSIVGHIQTPRVFRTRSCKEISSDAHLNGRRKINCRSAGGDLQRFFLFWSDYVLSVGFRCLFLPSFSVQVFLLAHPVCVCFVFLACTPRSRLDV